MIIIQLIPYYRTHHCESVSLTRGTTLSTWGCCYSGLFRIETWLQEDAASHMANKVPTDGHKSLNVQQSRFLSDVFAKEDKYRSLMIKNGNKRMSKARNPLIQSARSNGRSTKNRQKKRHQKQPEKSIVQEAWV